MEVTNNKPTIKVQHSPRESESSEVSSKRSSVGLLPHRIKRNDHLGLFRSASPVTTSSSTNETNLFLALPTASKGGRSLSAASLCNDGANGFLSDEKLLIKSFEILANAIGFKKSFSTSDILGIESSAQYSSSVTGKPFLNLNRSHSEIQLSNYTPLFRLEASSRSLSTWVAVGDTSATTQLPSPQARVGSASPSFTPADLVRSVNKRIRQTYLKKRLLTTYKALERMSEMGFNLEKLREVVSEGELAAHPDLVNLLSSKTGSNPSSQKNPVSKKTEAEVVKAASAVVAVASEATNTSQLGVTSMSGSTSVAMPNQDKTGGVAGSKTRSLNKEKREKTLSCKEIERDRGKPLSKFDRNVMIFDWLHGLDELATIDLT